MAMRSRGLMPSYEAPSGVHGARHHVHKRITFVETFVHIAATESIAEATGTRNVIALHFYALTARPFVKVDMVNIEIKLRLSSSPTPG